jgi:hypothetical protein
MIVGPDAIAFSTYHESPLSKSSILPQADVFTLLLAAFVSTPKLKPTASPVYFPDAREIIGWPFIFSILVLGAFLYPHGVFADISCSLPSGS